MKFRKVFTPQLGRDVWLREGTSDQQVWNDVFGGAGGYHLPPEEMPAPERVLDLGANIGLTTADYQTLWPDARVVGVELDHDNAEMARRNVESCTTILTMAVTLSGEYGTYRLGGPEEAYSVTPEYIEGDYKRAHPINFLALSVAVFGDAPIDFLKLDIEGAEWDLVEGGSWWRDDVKHLLVECHDNAQSPEANVQRMCALLAALGYEARHHPPHPQAVYASRT